MNEEEDYKAMKSNDEKRSIKLYCPQASKMAEIIAVDDHRLDMGTIARIFGVEPWSLKLNGHFISRGVDFVASSVTWRSLLSFFSSRGLSTGTLDSSPLLVHGKLSKPGSKRLHDPTEVDNMVPSSRIVDKNPWQEDIKSPDNKKLKENYTERENNCQRAKCSDTGLKRKHWLQNISPFKKYRVGESITNDISQGHDERGSNTKSSVTNLPCGYLVRENMKRMREDEVIVGVAAPFKRAR